MAEMTLKVQVDLPPEFAVAGPYAELVQAGLGFLRRVRWADDRWVFDGSAKDWETFGNLCAAGVGRCREMEASLPMAPAPRSSGDVILELTHRVAALSELVGVNHRARRAAEKALADVWKLAGASVADLDKRLAEKSVAKEEVAHQSKTDKLTTPYRVTIVLCQSPGWERRGAVYLNGMLTGVVTDENYRDFLGNNSAERQAWAIVRATGWQARVTEAFVKWSWLESLDEVFPDNLADIHPDAWVDGEPTNHAKAA
jgi:hypothetical protein